MGRPAHVRRDRTLGPKAPRVSKRAREQPLVRPHRRGPRLGMHSTGHRPRLWSSHWAPDVDDDRLIVFWDLDRESCLPACPRTLKTPERRLPLPPQGQATMKLAIDIGPHWNGHARARARALISGIRDFRGTVFRIQYEYETVRCFDVQLFDQPPALLAHLVRHFRGRARVIEHRCQRLATAAPGCQPSPRGSPAPHHWRMSCEWRCFRAVVPADRGASDSQQTRETRAA